MSTITKSQNCQLIKDGEVLHTGTYSECHSAGYEIETSKSRWEPFPPPFNKFRNPEYSIIDTETGENVF